MKRNWGLILALALILTLVVGQAYGYVRERISIDAGEDVWVYNGASLRMYSDDHTTTTLLLDGSSGAITAGAMAQASLAVGGGYGDTGCSMSSAGVLQCNGAATTDGALTADSGVFGGGYGATGVTISTAGAISANDAIIAGGGYADTGCTLSAAGVLQCAGAATTDGTLTAADVAFGGGYGATGCTGSGAGALSCNDLVIAGGGYGDTGCTLSAAGVLQCNGAATTDGTITAADAAIGGGYGSSGCTISSAGALSCDGAAIVKGTVSDAVAGIAGALTLDDTHVDVTGSIFDSGGTLVLGDATQITSTLDILGAVSDSGGNLELSDDVDLGGGYGAAGCSVANASGNLQCNGALTVDGAATVAGATSSADVTLTANGSGGNAGEKTEFIGLPRIKLAGVGVKDGTGEVEVDDSPAAEWTALDADVTDTADTSYYKVGANSLKLAFAGTATAGDGATNATPGADWTGMKSIGFWVYADKVFTAAQLVLYLTDATDPSTLNTCAYSTASVWQYCEVDISALAGTVGDMVTDIDVRMAAGLNVPINIYIDNMVVWAAGDEVSLTVALQQDGDLGFINALTGAALDPSADYTIAWRTGVDYIVVIADLDPDGAFGMVAY